MAKAIKSAFKNDAEGWTVQGDVSSAGWEAHGGNPKGFFHWVDAASGQDSYFVAPAAYTGDKHNYYGATLAYDIYDSGNNAAGIPDVEIVGTNGVTLVTALGQPGTDWTHFQTVLTTGMGWHVGTLDGADATKADFKGVLADVSSLLIRAEYVSGAEEGGIDNVLLAKLPPPASHPVIDEAALAGFIQSSPIHLEHGHHAIA